MPHGSRFLPLACALGLLLGLWWSPQRAFANDDRPNILFFLVDDQRNDTLGCAGHPILETPTVDRLAETGVRFTNMFVTTSICAASRASIFTGLHERTHRFTFGTPPISELHTGASYPAVLRKNGYRTGFIGKFGVGVAGDGKSSMFDYFQPIGRNPYLKKQPDGTLRHESELAGDRAVDFLRSNPDNQPFCLSVSFNAVHAEDGDKRPGIGHYPWPAAVDGMYDDVTVPPPRLSEPEVFESQPDLLKTSLSRERFFWRWDTPQKYQTNIRAYFRMISGVDRVIGRVLDELDRQGVAKDTVVIYSADNGYYMGQRGFAGKWSHYEESLRVPLVIHDPRLSDSQQGRVLDCVALNIDLPATFLDLAGVAPPEHYQGRSLLPWVRGEEVVDWRSDFFCEHLMDAPGRIPKWEGVRGRRYVYARYFEDNYEFLHDLEVDPDQLRNFAEDPKYTTVLTETRRRSDELRDRYGGPYVPRPRPEKRRKKRAAKEGATYSDGVIGGSASFDGHSYLAAGKLPALKPGDDFSWSFWVRLEPGHRRQGVLIGNRASGNPGSTTFIKFTSHGLQYYGTANQSRRLSYDLPQNRWTHLAAVKSQANLTCYLNGSPVAEATVDFDLPELPFYLGGDPLAGELSVCSLDEVRTYHRALTPEEVHALSQKQSIEEELDGHWPLDGSN